MWEACVFFWRGEWNPRLCGPSSSPSGSNPCTLVSRANHQYVRRIAPRTRGEREREREEMQRVKREDKSNRGERAAEEAQVTEGKKKQRVTEREVAKYEKCSLGGWGNSLNSLSNQMSCCFTFSSWSVRLCFFFVLANFCPSSAPSDLQFVTYLLPLFQAFSFSSTLSFFLCVCASVSRTQLFPQSRRAKTKKQKVTCSINRDRKKERETDEYKERSKNTPQDEQEQVKEEEEERRVWFYLQYKSVTNSIVYHFTPADWQDDFNC